MKYKEGTYELVDGYHVVEAEKYKFKILTATMLAYTMDAYDLMCLALAIPILIKAWGITLAQAGLISTAALLGQAFGAYMWGPICDKYGRKPSYIICMGVFTVLTMLCAVSHNFITLIVFRVLAGTALGGAWSLGATLATEFFPTKQAARATSAIQSAWPIGYLIAILVNLWMVPVYGWQVLFIMGGLAVIPVIYMAFFMPESPIWLKLKIARDHGEVVVKEAVAVLETVTEGIFDRKNRLPLFLSTMLIVSTLVSYWGAASWIPTYLATERGLKLSALSGYLVVVNVCGFLGYYAFGYLADRIGRKWNFVVGGVGSAIVVILFLQIQTPIMGLVMGGLFGFITYGYWGPQAAFVAEQFPAHIRGTCVSLGFGTAKLVSAIVPFAMGGLAMKYSLGFALSLLCVIYASGGIFAWFMKDSTVKSKTPPVNLNKAS